MYEVINDFNRNVEMQTNIIDIILLLIIDLIFNFQNHFYVTIILKLIY